MALRPSLVRSIPFWILLAASVASVIAGAMIVVEKIGIMSTALTAGTATGVEVYVGQSWIVVGGALIAAGLIGVVTVLALAVVRELLPATPVTIVEPVDALDDEEIDVIDSADLDTIDNDDVTVTQVELEPTR